MNEKIFERKDVYVYFVDGKPYINLSNRCTNNCVFCIRHNREGMEGATLWLNHEPTAQEVIAQLPQDIEKYPETTVCGFGEPTFNLDALLGAGRFLRERGVRVRLNTNGHGNAINGRDITAELKEAADIVSVSLNESNSRDYQRICQCDLGEKGFDEMLDFAAKCKAQNIEVVFSVVDTIGAASVEKCRRIAESLRIPLRVRKYIPEP